MVNITFLLIFPIRYLLGFIPVKDPWIPLENDSDEAPSTVPSVGTSESNRQYVHQPMGFFRGYCCISFGESHGNMVSIVFPFLEGQVMQIEH